MKKKHKLDITGVTMMDIACIVNYYGPKAHNIVSVVEEEDFRYRIRYTESSKMIEDYVRVRGHVQPRLFVLDTKTVAEW